MRNASNFDTYAEKQVKYTVRLLQGDICLNFLYVMMLGKKT